MKRITVTVGDFKARFSEMVESVKEGNQVEITYGRKRNVIGYFVLVIEPTYTIRKLGLLADKAEVIINDEDFEITDEDLVSE
jgi:hypothetical protein